MLNEHNKNELIEHINKCINYIDEINEKNIKQEDKNSFIFQKRKNAYVINSYDILIKRISNKLWLIGKEIDNKDEALNLFNLSNDIEKIKDLNNIKNKLISLKEIVNKIKTKQIFDVNLIPDKIKVPNIISEEINSDLKELKQCFCNNLYKSSVILCGRILEVSLHRKYYEITNKDILETQPGIGLGKLVAKLYEKNVKFDPGINEQIHLINKIRVQSVHKKHEHFIPSREQAYATILYTLDIVKKLFN